VYRKETLTVSRLGCLITSAADEHSGPKRVTEQMFPGYVEISSSVARPEVAAVAFLDRSVLAGAAAAADHGPT
jgi:hypothetical protein